MYKELAFISSPFRNNRKRNIAYAKELMFNAIWAGYVPIVPHLLYPQVLNDKCAADRQTALCLCQELISRSDVVIVGERYGISEGMHLEIAWAKELGKRIVYKDA